MKIALKTFGNSMYPLFGDGNIVNITKTSLRKIKVNDIITYKSSAKLITHRVIYKSLNKNPYLITKGDNNPLSDGKISPKQIIGRVESVKRGGKTLSIESIYLFQSTFYFQEIIKIVNLFSKLKIDFLILKGLPLHLYFEKKHPRRIYVDCDVLIDKNQFELVKKIMIRLGFHISNFELTKTHTKLKDKITETSFEKTINGFKIVFDIHLEAVFLMTQLGKLDPLYPQKLIDKFTKKILSEKKFIIIFGIGVPILSEENLLIYLTLHLFHHNYTGYYRYELLKNILKRGKINFKKVSEIITEYKFEGFVYPVFLYLDKYYDTSLPPYFLQAIQPNHQQLEYIKKNILKIGIFNDEIRTEAGVNRFKHIFYLSSSPFYKKVLIFTNSQVLYSIYFVIKMKLMILKLRYNFFRFKFFY